MILTRGASLALAAAVVGAQSCATVGVVDLATTPPGPLSPSLLYCCGGGGCVVNLTLIGGGGGGVGNGNSPATRVGGSAAAFWVTFPVGGTATCANFGVNVGGGGLAGVNLTNLEAGGGGGAATSIVCTTLPLPTLVAVAGGGGGAGAALGDLSFSLAGSGGGNGGAPGLFASPGGDGSCYNPFNPLVPGRGGKGGNTSMPGAYGAGDNITGVQFPCQSVAVLPGNVTCYNGVNGTAGSPAAGLGGLSNPGVGGSAGVAVLGCSSTCSRVNSGGAVSGLTFNAAGGNAASCPASGGGGGGGFYGGGGGGGSAIYSLVTSPDKLGAAGGGGGGSSYAAPGVTYGGFFTPPIGTFGAGGVLTPGSASNGVVGIVNFTGAQFFSATPAASRTPTPSVAGSPSVSVSRSHSISPSVSPTAGLSTSNSPSVSASFIPSPSTNTTAPPSPSAGSSNALALGLGIPGALLLLAGVALLFYCFRYNPRYYRSKGVEKASAARAADLAATAPASPVSEWGSGGKSERNLQSDRNLIRQDSGKGKTSFNPTHGSYATPGTAT